MASSTREVIKMAKLSANRRKNLPQQVRLPEATQIPDRHQGPSPRRTSRATQRNTFGGYSTSPESRSHNCLHGQHPTQTFAHETH